ncbi:hypothetical protein MBH78_21520 [Oceanimonas sp. NS1]|nr:hypothetical protein [Oceanimonas sp. NS1]
MFDLYLKEKAGKEAERLQRKLDEKLNGELGDKITKSCPACWTSWGCKPAAIGLGIKKDQGGVSRPFYCSSGVILLRLLPQGHGVVSTFTYNNSKAGAGTQHHGSSNIIAG